MVQLHMGYRRTGFNRIVKSLRVLVLKANCILTAYMCIILSCVPHDLRSNSCVFNAHSQFAIIKLTGPTSPEPL